MVLLDALLRPGAGVDRPDAVTVAGRRLSDGELLAAASALAVRLEGAPAVAVDASASLETVVGVVAGLLAGVPVVPVPADAGPRERAHILGDSGATVLLTTTDPPSGPQMGPTPDDPAAAIGPGRMAVDIRASHPGGTLPSPPADAPALILYTSGTTGPPKGVVIGADAVAADLDGLATAWEWTADDVLVHGLPLFHVHGLVLGVLGALRIGCRLVHTGRPTPAAYASVAEGTLYFGVPTVWSRVAADAVATAALHRARLLVSGSAGLPGPVFDALREGCGQGPLERYGMTETLITLSGRVDGERRPGSVGTALPGVEARVVADDGTTVAADGATIGSLQVRGATLMRGYLGRPDVTAASYSPDGWFLTGDAALVDVDGQHRIVGRESTDLIKTGGYRVGAGEVENALLAHPAVREAAVVGVPDDDLGQVVVAHVIADSVTEAELIDWVAGDLSVHKRPRRVVLCETLPRNAMGKVQKKLLGS